MRSETSDRPKGARLLPLTKQEIDRRIERVLADVAGAPSRPTGTEGAETLRPRPISAAELVRRVAPFIGRN